MNTHHDIWQQVVAGRTKWTPEDTGGSIERFEKEVFQVLRRLEGEGKLRLHVAHYAARRGRKWPDVVEIERL